jgi:hypothetical protein
LSVVDPDAKEKMKEKKKKRRQEGGVLEGATSQIAWSPFGRSNQRSREFVPDALTSRSGRLATILCLMHEYIRIECMNVVRRHPHQISLGGWVAKMNSRIGSPLPLLHGAHRGLP